MHSPQSDCSHPSLRNNTPCLDGSFNKKTHFCGKTMFAKNDAINLLNIRPIQPSSKLLNNMFNGNNTTIFPNTKPLIGPM